MRLFFTLIFILISSVSFASQKAITDTGEEVILYDDGSWVYSDKTNQIENEILTNTETFQKPESSTFLLKSTINSSAYWINPKKWSFEKGTGSAEYKFELKGSDLYGMSVSEGMPIPLETFPHIAVENAKEVSPDIKIVKKEYRIVNGNRVLYLELQGKIQGIDFMYLGYYYSDDSGSTQFLVYTGQNLVSKYISEINDFLNGFASQ